MRYDTKKIQHHAICYHDTNAPTNPHLASPLDDALEGLVERNVGCVHGARRRANQLAEVHPALQGRLVGAADAGNVPWVC